MGPPYITYGAPFDCSCARRQAHRLVAIKVLHAHFSSDPSFAERFLREARAMARLDHDNIICIHGVEEHEGEHYIVMEDFVGRRLANISGTFGVLPCPTSNYFAYKNCRPRHRFDVACVPFFHFNLTQEIRL